MPFHCIMPAHFTCITRHLLVVPYLHYFFSFFFNFGSLNPWLLIYSSKYISPLNNFLLSMLSPAHCHCLGLYPSASLTGAIGFCIFFCFIPYLILASLLA